MEGFVLLTVTPEDVRFAEGEGCEGMYLLSLLSPKFFAIADELNDACSQTAGEKDSREFVNAAASFSDALGFFVKVIWSVNGGSLPSFDEIDILAEREKMGFTDTLRVRLAMNFSPETAEEFTFRLEEMLDSINEFSRYHLMVLMTIIVEEVVGRIEKRAVREIRRQRRRKTSS